MRRNGSSSNDVSTPTPKGMTRLPKISPSGECISPQRPLNKEKPDEYDEEIRAENIRATYEEFQQWSPGPFTGTIFGGRYDLTLNKESFDQDGNFVVKMAFRRVGDATRAHLDEDRSILKETGAPYAGERRSRSSHGHHAHSLAGAAMTVDEWRSSVPSAPFRPPYESQPSSSQIKDEIPVTPPRQRRYSWDGSRVPSPRLIGSIRRHAVPRREATVIMSPGIARSPEHSPSERMPDSDSLTDEPALRYLNPEPEDDASGVADEEKNELDYDELYGPASSPKTPTFPRLRM